jgi:hypothetical protein
MSFDEMYDEMLQGEFNSHGKHAAKAAVEATPAPVVSEARGKHAVLEASTVDDAETGEVAEVAERPRGFQRYRTAALVGAGGMACAAAGAFLGGLGGYFTISPAAAHPLASPTVTQDLPLAQAVSNATHSASSGSAKGTSAVAAADFSKPSGSLTQGIAPFATLTSEPLANLPVVSLPTQPGTSSVTGSDGTDNGGTGTGSTGGTGDNGGSGGTTTGGLTGCASGTSDLGLTCILDSLTSALSNLGSLGSLSGGGDPTNVLTNLMPSLSGVVTDVTGTLQNLTSLLPIASLPSGGGTGGTTVLAGAASPLTTGSPSTTGGGASNAATSPIVSALSPVLNSVAAVAGGVTGSTPSLPSLPLASSGGTSSIPSLPVQSSSGSTPAAPTVTTSGSSSGTSNTINVPIPVPLPIDTPTVSIGGLSIGINTTDSGGGLTLTLP